MLSRTTKDCLGWTATFIVLCALTAVGLFYWDSYFCAPGRRATASPVNPAWEVDLIDTGFRHHVMELAIYDERKFLEGPKIVGLLLHRDYAHPQSVFWSTDGSLIVAVVRLVEGKRPAVYACAYDFRKHRAYKAPQTGPDSPDFQKKVSDLLTSRGGPGERLVLSDY